MTRLGHAALVTGLGLALAATLPGSIAAQAKAPPGGDYKEVSTLVALPNYIPGLGTLYVNPATLPAGPFLAYEIGRAHV